MGKVYEKIDDRWADFIKAQKMFFVATAPLSADGHVNVSPKGYDSFAILNPLTVAYLDVGGSGIETVAHVQENERITIMFCAFEGAAKILRLYGHGEALDFNHPEFADLMKLFPSHDRARNIIRVKLTRIQDSCGWGVPFYEFKSERDQLLRYYENKTSDEIRDKIYVNNAQSLDGLTGIEKPE
ncbi:MAG: pyridoxamine 5'-phosphate oxidase family protein [Aquisalinus sp.]|nr:pyridoxamine 5'-phosphate oxidase family protein [Aquisalinus sp.]